MICSREQIKKKSFGINPHRLLLPRGYKQLWIASDPQKENGRACFAGQFIPKGTRWPYGNGTFEVDHKAGDSDRAVNGWVDNFLWSYGRVTPPERRPVNPEHPTCYIQDYRRHGELISSDRLNCEFMTTKPGSEAHEVWVVATRDITGGKQLFIDYGDEFWDGIYSKSRNGERYVYHPRRSPRRS